MSEAPHRPAPSASTALSDLSTDDLAAVVDPVFAEVMGRNVAPGLVYGVVAGGQVLHARGLGIASEAGPLPGTGTLFRIASMTKSVTAATVLSLRDDGLLSLDQPAGDLVPELLAGGAQSRHITLRHLLTMTAGFPTDDPWGDRQQDLPHDHLRRLLAGGLAPTWPPGERFEYSNLGYAVLGLAVEAVTHMPYADVAAMRVLRPLGMDATGYHLDELDRRRLARGYVHRSTGWVEEPWAGYGAFAPMGGLFSTVDDLARWVGVLQAAQPAEGRRAPAPTGSFLAPSSLREMQTTQRLVAAVSPAGETAPEVTGYGFGLFEEFRAWGRTVFHSGGYPGFGSHMRWHPASGLGVIVLANGTYAPVYAPAREALRQLVTSLELPQRRPLPEPPSLAVAVSTVTSWLEADTPDGEEAEALRSLFADNVELDVPWAERVVQWNALRRALGPAPREVPGTRRRPSPATASWEIEGNGARGRVLVMLAPHDLRLVQSVTLRPVGGPGSGAAADDEGEGQQDTMTEWS